MLSKRDLEILNSISPSASQILQNPEGRRQLITSLALWEDEINGGFQFDTQTLGAILARLRLHDYSGLTSQALVIQYALRIACYIAHSR